MTTQQTSESRAGRKPKNQLVRKGIRKVLEEANPEEPHSPSRLERELKEICGVEASWDTVKKYAEELADEGRIRRADISSDDSDYDNIVYISG